MKIIKTIKTKYNTLNCWAILAFVISGIGATLIMTTSYLTNRGYDLPPWF